MKTDCQDGSYSKYILRLPMVAKQLAVSANGGGDYS